MFDSVRGPALEDYVLEGLLLFLLLSGYNN